MWCCACRVARVVLRVSYGVFLLLVVIEVLVSAVVRCCQVEPGLLVILVVDFTNTPVCGAVAII